MEKDRLAAFSDGVIAVIITIMVLELKTPTTPDLSALQQIIPGLLSYVLSFIYVAIYWNNHHHLLHTVRRVNGAMLWANTHLLFWLSLTPLAAAWMGRNFLAVAPTSVYGMLLLMCALSYYILQKIIIAAHGEQALLKQALGRDLKGKISLLLYIFGIILACRSPLLAQGVYGIVALIWLIPDQRIEKKLNQIES